MMFLLLGEQIHQVLPAKSKSFLPFIWALVHTGAVADLVNFSDAVKHWKKNYHHMLMFYLLFFLPSLSLSLSVFLTLFPLHLNPFPP